MTSWSLDELHRWEDAAREVAIELGLDFYPQDFEICSHEQMLGYTAYHGMPAHYPHWSFGKSFEKTKTMYDLGVTGLPYELVINSNPCLAYLMRDNTLCLQILTIAHVFAHNDFFKNNYMFAKGTRADLALARVKNAADIVRGYMEDPSIGEERVERVLDAAHALSMNMSRNPLARKRTREEQIRRANEMAQAAHKRDFEHLRGTDKWQEYVPPNVHKDPIEPDLDLLLFIRDHNRELESWEQNLLTIVHEEAAYFIPQIETKIMNEGWASLFHHRIMHQLALPRKGRPRLPDEVFQEFLVRHNQVVCPHPKSLNPYWLGFMLYVYGWWVAHAINTDKMVPAKIIPFDPTIRDRVEFRRLTEDEEERFKGLIGKDPEQELFRIRDADRDASFLNRYLYRDIMMELDLFEFEPRGDNLVVTKVASDDGWRDVKSTLIQTVGMNSQPVIEVVDGSHGGAHTLLLRHVHDGRDLHIGYAEKTMAHVHALWRKQVLLETLMKGKPTLLSYGEHGFDAKLAK